MKWFSCFIFGIIWILAVCIPARAERGVNVESLPRTALVIGNAAYPNAPLRNPVNDAVDMAKALKETGFDVTLLTDAGKRKMDEAIDAFGRKLRKGGAGLFYYAGHGIQLDGSNYLIPVDARIASESDVKYHTVEAGWVLGKMADADNGLNIIILDACRNNPFARSFRSAEMGLAIMDAPRGSIIAYSTAPGSVAEDGKDRNGIYTGKLLKHLKKPNLKVEEVLKNTRVDVVAETGERQTPWDATCLTGDFYFNTGGGDVTVIMNPPSESGALPPSQEKIGDFDDVIRKRQEARQKWTDWQERMTQAYAKVEGYEKSSLLTAAEKKAAWDKFLDAYNAENPYSTDDDGLRQKAAHRQEYWLALGSRPEAPVEKSTAGQSVTNSLGMEFVYIEPGTFMMRRSSREPGRRGDVTRHQVTLTRGFYMQTTEVTQGQWQAIMGNNPSHFSNCGKDCPVENVSWDDVQEFIKALNRKEGKSYRLPTDADWEYAARAGSKGRFCFGDSDSQLGEYAWYSENSGDKTHPVGQKRSNEWGLYDMHGNVWEWCQDGEGDYPGGSVTNPTGPSSGAGRVFRGSSWDGGAGYCSFGGRGAGLQSGRFDDGGFRLVLLPGQ